MTSTVRSDGVTPGAASTPYYLMADAFAHKRAALAQAGARAGERVEDRRPRRSSIRC